MEKTLTIDHPSGTREITVEEALQQRTYRDALAGKRPAMREVLRWMKKREAWLAEHMPKASRHDFVLRTSDDPDNADTALLLLGIAAANPARADWGKDRAQLLLEPCGGSGGPRPQARRPTPDRR
jgi:hypothetical protein